jgi:hypothetical protein
LAVWIQTCSSASRSATCGFRVALPVAISDPFLSPADGT